MTVKRENQQDAKNAAVLCTFYQLIPFSPRCWAQVQGLGGVSSTPSFVPLRVIATTVSSLIYYVCQKCARFPMRDAQYGRSRVALSHPVWNLVPFPSQLRLLLLLLSKTHLLSLRGGT